MKNKKKIAKVISPWLYILPLILLTVVFSLYPAINTIVLSFKEDYRLLSSSYSSFGTANYDKIFSDRYFLQSIINTLKYTVITVPIAMLLSILLAVLLNQKIRFSAFFQTTFFLPLVTSTTAIAYSWRLIFNSQYGIINDLLTKMCLRPVPWLTSSDYSLTVLVVYGVWSLIPFSVLTILGSLQGIDESYYIAAKIDNASDLKIFLRVTLPEISQNIFLLSVVNTISSFRVFDELFPLFSGKPGPSFNMYTMVYYIYEQMQSFSVGSYGRAAAAATVFFVLLLGLSIIQYLLRKSIRKNNDG